MNFPPTQKALSSVNGMQRLLMVYFWSLLPWGHWFKSRLYKVSLGKMLQTEGCAVNYVKWVGGLSQELSWLGSNSQKPPIQFKPLLAVSSREWLNAKWLSGHLLLSYFLWGSCKKTCFLADSEVPAQKKWKLFTSRTSLVRRA